MSAKKENKTLRKKLHVLEKSVEYGLKSERDYANLSAKEYHKLRKKCRFHETDSDIFFELCEAIKSNKLITYLSEEENKGDDEFEQRTSF